MSVFKRLQAAAILMLLAVVFLAETAIDAPVIVEKLYLSTGIILMLLFVKGDTQKGISKTEPTNTY